MNDYDYVHVYDHVYVPFKSPIQLYHLNIFATRIIIIIGVNMNYLIKETLEQTTGYYLEITVLIIVGIVLILSIIMLTIIKKLKDK